jgi:hypothetical protein
MPTHCGARCETQALVRSSLAAATASGPSATTRALPRPQPAARISPAVVASKAANPQLLQVTVQFEVRHLNGADVNLKPDHRPIGCRHLAARDPHR